MENWFGVTCSMQELHPIKFLIGLFHIECELCFMDKHFEFQSRSDCNYQFSREHFSLKGVVTG